MSGKRTGTLGVGLTLAGVAGLLVAHWMVFLWVPTEVTQGVIQRIFYVHVPAAWITEFAFGLTAVCSCVYLWLKDDRVDAAAVAAAEGGLYFCVILLIAGPLWGRVAWGAFWSWEEPRLTFTLLLFFIFIGYFMVRGSASDPERGKRLAAIVAIVGAADIPLIHMSVYWFRSLHPEPVVLRPDGATADSRMLATLFVALAAYTLVFLGLLYLRYGVERAERGWKLRSTRNREVVT